MPAHIAEDVEDIRSRRVPSTAQLRREIGIWMHPRIRLPTRGRSAKLLECLPREAEARIMDSLEGIVDETFVNIRMVEGTPFYPLRRRPSGSWCRSPLRSLPPLSSGSPPPLRRHTRSLRLPPRPVHPGIGWRAVPPEKNEAMDSVLVRSHNGDPRLAGVAQPHHDHQYDQPRDPADQRGESEPDRRAGRRRPCDRAERYPVHIPEPGFDHCTAINSG